MAVPVASLGSSLSSFADAVGDFFSNLAAIQPQWLVLGLLSFGVYLGLRAKAYQHVLRAAFPNAEIEYKRIWGAYMAGYGLSQVVPARGGDIAKLFLVKSSVRGSNYPAIGSSFFVENVFDLVIGGAALLFALTQGAFPKLPDLSSLPAPDLQLLFADGRRALFSLTVIGVGVLVAFAVLSARVRAFWTRVRQGIVILRDRDRYLREVFAVQLAGWVFRFAAFWLLLEAFNVGGSVTNVLLVLGVNAVAAGVPVSPGGAGVQQAMLVKVFSGTAAGATVAAYSVGQQIAIAAFSLGVGFVAIVWVFGFRSFKEVIAAGKADREGRDVQTLDALPELPHPTGPKAGRIRRRLARRP